MSTGDSRPAVATVPEGWTPATAPDPLVRAKHGIIGAQVSRLDGPLKVQGAAPFGAEYVMEGMVYARSVTARLRAAASRRSTPRPPKQQPASCS